MKVAILDDYQNAALNLADWSSVASRAEITVFNDHLDAPDAVVERLLPFDAICVMRERTPLPREIVNRLPQLQLIASTGPRNPSIDKVAAEERDIRVTATGYRSTPTVEMTWALILAIGRELDGKVLGVLGLGNIGVQVARIALAFGMKVIAWSQNMTPEIAAAAGAVLVTKEELFRQADLVTIHLILSKRTRGLVGAADLAFMKSTSWLVNTSRGPIVDQGALVRTLTSRAIEGAALDVFDTEPLPAGHPSGSSSISFVSKMASSPSTGMSSRTKRPRSLRAAAFRCSATRFPRDARWPG